MRVLERVPGKYLLPLAAVFGTVVGFGALPAAAAEPGSVEVITGSEGTGQACAFHVFAQGFQEGQELRFTVHHHPDDGAVVLENTFGIGANGHGRSPAGGEHTLPNGTYELHLIASPPGKTPPHPDEYGRVGSHGAQAAAADVKFPAGGDRTAKLFHDQFERVFELACENAEPEAPQVPAEPEEPKEPTNPGTQQEPVEVTHETSAPQEPQTPTWHEPARPEQPNQQPQEPHEPERTHQPELPRTGVSITKLLAGGAGLMLIGAFLVASTVRRRTSS